MPELVNCRVCNHKISTSAKSCPNCGDFPSSINKIKEESKRVWKWLRTHPTEEELQNPKENETINYIFSSFIKTLFISVVVVGTLIMISIFLDIR